MKRITLLCVMMMLARLPLLAGSYGKPDSTLNGTGLLELHSDAGGHSVRAIRLPDSRLLVGGKLFLGANLKFTVARFHPNGSLDQTYGNKGIAILDELPDAAGQGMNIAPSAGSSLIVMTRYGVARLDSTGSLDTSFGRKGYNRFPDSVANLFSPDRIPLAVNNDGSIYTVLTERVRVFPDDYTKIHLFCFTPAGLRNPDFGQQGYDTVRLPKYMEISEVLIQHDGRLICSGTLEPGYPSAVICMRFKAAASLDSSYGTNGIFLLNSFGTSSNATAAALRPDGKLIVCGNYTMLGSPLSAAVLQLRPDGSIDSAFGINGVARLNTTRGTLPAFNNLSLLPDGQIAACGQRDSSFIRVALLARFRADGTADSAFGVNGYLLDSFYHRWLDRSYPLISNRINGDGATSVVSLDSNRLLYCEGTGNLADGIQLAAFDAAGALDSNFGIGGKVRVRPALQWGMGLCSIPLPDGRILAGGTFRTAAVTLRHPDGRVDSSFADAGLLDKDLSEFPELSPLRPLTAMVRSPKGSIYAGYVEQSGIKIKRFHSDGRPDSSYGKNGAVWLDLQGNVRMILQPDGKLLVSGKGAGISIGAVDVITRLHLNGAPDRNFGIGGRIETKYHPNASTTSYVFSQLTKSGRILLCNFGDQTPGRTEYLYVERYLANGTLDRSFGSNGLLMLNPLSRTDFLFSSYRLPVIAEDSLGRLVIAAATDDAVSYLFRYYTDGRIDSSFHGTGHLRTPLVGGASTYGDHPTLLLQPDGKIILGSSSAGRASNFNAPDSIRIGLFRCDSTGSSDTSFGDNGLVFPVAGARKHSLRSACFDYAGRVLITGAISGRVAQAFLIARVTTGMLPFKDTLTEDTAPVTPDDTTTGIPSNPRALFNVQVHPNPVTPGTVLGYTLSQTTNVEIRIVDASGLVSRRVLSESQAAGTYHVPVLLHELPTAGVYMLEVRAGKDKATLKLTVQ